MDDNIHKEQNQLPDEEAAQIDGGAIGKDLLWLVRWVECLKCKRKFDKPGMQMNTDSPCPYCGGKLIETMKTV